MKLALHSAVGLAWDQICQCPLQQPHPAQEHLPRAEGVLPSQPELLLPFQGLLMGSALLFDSGHAERGLRFQHLLKGSALPFGFGQAECVPLEEEASLQVLKEVVMATSSVSAQSKIAVQICSEHLLTQDVCSYERMKGDLQGTPLVLEGEVAVSCGILV